MGEAHRKAEARAELAKRNANTYAAGRAQDLAAQRRSQSERQLGVEESLLGTDEQVNGTLGGVSAEVLPYLGRYQFDANASALHTNAFTNKKLGSGFLQGRTDQANALLQQAEDAARNGDFTTAEKLKAQAAGGLLGGKEFGELQGVEGLDQIFSLVEDPAAAARSRLGSTQAQILGKQVQESKAFQDFNSEASINERKNLSAAGERSIAAASRDSMRQNRMDGMGGGAASTAYGRQLSNERSARDFGAQRAQLFAGVAQGFQEMQRKYAKDTLGFAREWLQGGSGIRAEFQAALDGLKANLSNVLMSTAQMNQDMAKFQFGRADEEQARKDVRAQRYQNMMLSLASLSAGNSSGTPGQSGGAVNTVESGKADSGKSQGAMQAMMMMMGGG